MHFLKITWNGLSELRKRAPQIVMVFEIEQLFELVEEIFQLLKA